MKNFFAILVLSVLPSLVWAQGAGAAQKGAKVLDFEGEEIEGERMRPDLFLQITGEDLSFDSLIYLRENFNDFHEIEKKSKPRYVRPSLQK
jgi:hypothetical protein